MWWIGKKLVAKKWGRGIGGLGRRFCVGDKKEASYEETRPEIGGLGRRFCVGERKKLVTKKCGQAVGG